jgi:hypothetical protein
MDWMYFTKSSAPEALRPEKVAFRPRAALGLQIRIAAVALPQQRAAWNTSTRANC